MVIRKFDKYIKDKKERKYKKVRLCSARHFSYLLSFSLTEKLVWLFGKQGFISGF